jgi:hypothetical protein
MFGKTFISEEKILLAFLSLRVATGCNAMFLDQVAAIDLVREMMISTGEEVEVRKYKRLTELIIEVTFWCIF